ncbi:hypothetical protein [Flagellimonas marinaquae]
MFKTTSLIHGYGLLYMNINGFFLTGTSIANIQNVADGQTHPIAGVNDTHYGTFSSLDTNLANDLDGHSYKMTEVATQVLSPWGK